MIKKQSNPSPKENHENVNNMIENSNPTDRSTNVLEDKVMATISEDRIKSNADKVCKIERAAQVSLLISTIFFALFFVIPCSSISSDESIMPFHFIKDCLSKDGESSGLLAIFYYDFLEEKKVFNDIFKALKTIFNSDNSEALEWIASHFVQIVIYVMIASVVIGIISSIINIIRMGGQSYKKNIAMQLMKKCNQSKGIIVIQIVLLIIGYIIWIALLTFIGHKMFCLTFGFVNYLGCEWYTYIVPAICMLEFVFGHLLLLIGDIMKQTYKYTNNIENSI